MARISSIIDPSTGKGAVVEDLTRFISTPQLGSIRNDVSMGASRNLTPQRLANILRSAEDGDPDAYLSLAEEIEEKDLHYLSVIGQRKRQVAQLPLTLTAASKDEIDQIIAKDIQENLIDTGMVDAAIPDMLDAVGKGFSLTEQRWETGATKWKQVELQFVNPRFVRFDRETQRIPHLLGNNGELLPLAQAKFAYLEIKAKSGIPIRGGLARAAAWAYMFKNFAIKDWVQFCEVYGIPWRIGSYDQNASEGDKDALLRAVCSLSSDAAAIKPKAMDIEVVDSGTKTASSALYGDLAKYFDDQISKAVLGQTRTVDAAGGINNGDAGTEVREDIERADAKALATCITRAIFRPYVDFNYGAAAKCPAASIGRPETKNAQLMVDAAQKLGGGMKIRVADLREAVGFSEPQDNDEIYAPPAAAPSPFMFGAPPSPANDQAIQQSIAASRQRAELLAAELEGGGDAIAVAAQEQAKSSAELLKPLRDQILQVAALSSGADDFRRRLRALRPNVDVTPLADRLAMLTFQALAGGVVGDTLKN